MSRAMLKQMKMTRTKVEQQLLGEEVSLRSTLRNQRRASRKRLGRKRRKQPMEPLHPHQGDTQELLYQEALTKWCKKTFQQILLFHFTTNDLQVLFSHLDEVERCEIFDAMF